MWENEGSSQNTSPSSGATKIIHRDGRVEIVGKGDIVKTIDNRPYLNPKSRPSFRKNFVTDFWNKIWSESKDHIVRDANTGEEIHWKPGQSRKGIWDMGHVNNAKYSEIHAAYVRGEMTPAEFRDWYNNPDNYQIEKSSNNRSHRYE